MALWCCVLLLLGIGSSYSTYREKTTSKKSRLLLVQDDKIVLLNANKPNQRQIVTGQCKNAVAVNYLYREKTIYFTESGDKNEKNAEKSISSVDVTTGVVRKIIDFDLKTPDGLAVDWIGRKLYWTDSEAKRIEVAELDGSYRKVLFWQQLDRPRAIVVDPLRGYLYWTDWGEKAKIEKAGMHGSDRRKIVYENLSWPNGLTLDYELRRLYWVDAHMREIASCDLEGNDIQVHYNMEKKRIYNGHPFAMTVLNGHLFYSDWDTYAVYSIEKQNATSPRIVVDTKGLQKNSQNLKRAMDIKGYDATLQPMLANGKRHPCQIANGKCSNLCLLKPTPPYYACACPTGIRYDQRSGVCPLWPSRMLILARENSLFTISLDQDDYTMQTMRVKTESPLVVDYDPIEKMVYWADSSSEKKSVKNLQRAHLSGRDQQEIVGADICSPDGIAVDWIGRNLYWTDANANRIWISRLDGSSPRVLLWRDLDEPRAIAVDPIHGFLYWSDWGHSPKIERSQLDGSNRTIIESRKEYVIWPNGLAIDYVNKHLYYSDARLDNIQRCNLDGSDRTTVAENHSPHIFGFTMLGKYLYWTDWETRSVARIEKNGLNKQKVLKGKSGLMGLKAVDRDSWIRAPHNPCGTNRGGCSHICLFYPFPSPHRRCSCPEDHELLADGRTCHWPEAYVIHSQGSHLRRLSASSNGAKEPLDALPLTALFNASQIAFDFRTKRIFWIDRQKQGLYQAFLSGSAWSPVTEVGVDEPRCLAVDWINRNLYFGHARPRARIEMVSIRLASSGKLSPSPHKRVLIHEGLNDPTALAVDPIGGWMYWADALRGQKAKVARAYLNGQRQEALFTVPGRITDMTVDLSVGNKRLLWANRHAIHASDLRGKHRERVFFRPGWNIIGLDVYSSYIYFSETTTKSIYRLRKNAGPKTEPTVLYSGARSSDLLVFVSVRQPGRCRCCGGECHQFCLPSKRTTAAGTDELPQCGCASHYSLLTDRRTCQPPLSYILAVTHSGRVIRYVPKTPGGSDPADVILTVPGVRNVRSFVVVPENNFLFYIDGETETIRRVNMVSEHVIDLVPNPRSAAEVRANYEHNRVAASKLHGKLHMLSPYELAYDPINRFLYWSDPLNHVINVTSTSGEPKGVVIQLGQRTPRSLTVDPVRGQIYWVSTNVNGSEPRIEQADLDGQGRSVIVSDDLQQPQHLLVHGRNLYWIDSKTEHLQKWDIEHRVRTALLHGLRSTLGSPAGLVVLEGFLYWYSNSMLLRVVADSAENAFVERFRLEGYDRIVDIAAVSHSSSTTSSSESSVVRLARTQCRCDFFCVPLRHSGKAFRCGCPLAMKLTGMKKCVRLRTCPSKQSLCKNSHNCIPSSWLCDGSEDCENGTDEKNCSCEKGEFRCRDGRCLPIHQRCDGNTDCDIDEECCGELLFQCRRKPWKCLPISKRCNRVRDCEDGSDEMDCSSVFGVAGGNMLTDGDTSSRTTYTVIVVIAVLAVILTCGIAGYTCTRRRRHAQANNQPYVMHTDQLDIMLVPKGPLFSGGGCANSDTRHGASSNSQLGASGSLGCSSTVATGSGLPRSLGSPFLSGASSLVVGSSGVFDGGATSKRRSRAQPPPDIISFYERDRLTGASRSDTDAPDYATCPLNPPPSPITDVGARGRSRSNKNGGRARKRRHRSGGSGTRHHHHHHHRRYHNVRLVIYTDAPPPTPRTCLSSAEETGGLGSGSPQSSRRSFAYNRPFPPPPSPENSSD